MSCYSCMAKVPSNNILNHNIPKYFQVHSLTSKILPQFLVRMLSGVVLLHLHIVFASGHYVNKESFLDFSNQFNCFIKEKNNQQPPSVKIL